MKKRILCLLGIVVAAGSMTACGAIKDSNEDKGTQIETIQFGDEIGKTDSTKENSEMKMFEDFIADKEVVYFDKVIENANLANYLAFSGMAIDEIKGKGFSFSEMVKLVCESETKAYWEKMEPTSFSYSYVDCGMDGKKELVIKFNGMGNYEEFTDIFVISCLNDKLQVVFSDSFGYRAVGEINENGYYIRAGSNGAASYSEDRTYINADGDVILDYSYEEVMSIWSLFIPDNDEYETVAAEQGIKDSIDIERYSFDYTNPSEDYMDYLLRSKWIYHATEDGYRHLYGDEYYEEGNPYKIFWNSTGLPLNTAEEIKEKIASHREEIGMKQEVEEGEEATYTELSQEAYEALFKWKGENYHYEGVSQEFTLTNPSWEYYYDGDGSTADKTVNIIKKSEKINNVIDTDEWFAGIGVEPLMWDSFRDENYSFYLYGGDTYYPYMMNISSSKSGAPIYTLDFTEYYESEAFKNGDIFTDESIGYAKIVDDILYVSTFHTTYASSESKNAYITAFDMKNDFKVIWKSEPLTCNSKNFEIIDDSIICGYGFTAEDDFIYILDRFTGKRKNSIRVNSSPEYFYYLGDALYVRTYDTNYVYDVVR